MKNKYCLITTTFEDKKEANEMIKDYWRKS